MYSYPNFPAVVEGLGDKVVRGLGEGVRRTRADLARYRALEAGWVADSGERGLANWLHDRLWSNAMVVFDDMPGVLLYERGPTREMTVHSRYRLRLKRHHMDGAVASFPTQTALDFFGTPVQLPFDGLGQIRLVAGYEWDRDRRQMGRAVLSLRESRDKVVWLEELPEVDDGSATDLVPAVDGSGPREPSISVDGGVGIEEKGEGG